MEFKRIDFLRLTDSQKEKLLSGKYIVEEDLTEEQWSKMAMLIGEYTNGQDFEECLKRDAKEFFGWLQEVWN